MRNLVFILLCLVGFVSHADDIICYKNGQIISACVTEITPTEIKYKKASNKSGPTFVENRSEILSIKFENGETEIFSENNIQDHLNPGVFMGNNRSVKIDQNNETLISKYNRLIEPTGQEEGKTTPYYITKWGIDTSSVLSNDEIEISFGFDYVYPFGVFKNAPYALSIKNKTDKTLIFDLERCNRVSESGKSRLFYDNSIQTSTTASQGFNIGASAVFPLSNLFPGINFGGGSSKSVTTLYNQNQFFILPPNAIENITYNNPIEIKRKRFRLLNVGEAFNTLDIIERKENRKNRVINFNKESSPKNYTYTLCYTTKDNPFEYTEIKFTVYLQQILCGVSGYNFTGFSYRIGEEFEYYGSADTGNLTKDLPKFYKKLHKDFVIDEDSYLLLGGNLYLR